MGSESGPRSGGVLPARNDQLILGQFDDRRVDDGRPGVNGGVDLAQTKAELSFGLVVLLPPPAEIKLEEIFATLLSEDAPFVSNLVECPVGFAIDHRSTV